MRLDEQRKWYEKWHHEGASDLPVEILKQQTRLYAIQALTKQFNYKTALVIGCGDGAELTLLNAGQLIAFDLSLTAAIKAREILPQNAYLQADGMKLPFADESFDLLFTSEVIEHILQPDAMLAEINRVLKPSGYLVISTPNWLSFFGMARWVGEKLTGRPVTSDQQPVDNWSTSKSLANLLEHAGLKVVNRRGAWYFPPTGKGSVRLPDRLMAGIFKLMLPVEHRLQSVFPSLGHLLIRIAQKRSRSL